MTIAAVLSNQLQYHIEVGDVLEKLAEIPEQCIHCCITSPPYWNLRQYQAGDKEIGQEKTPEAYVAKMVEVGKAVKRVLRDDGTWWLNLSSSYAQSGKGGGGEIQQTNKGSLIEATSIPQGYQAGDQVPIPWLVAIALQKSSWILRQDNIWVKEAPMPQSIMGWRWEKHRIKAEKSTRATQGYNGQAYGRSPQGAAKDGGINGSAKWLPCPGCNKCQPDGYILRKGSWRTTTAHEMIFMFAKNERYYADGFAQRQKLAQSTLIRDKYTRVLEDPNEQYAVRHDHETISKEDEGANLRSWFVFRGENNPSEHYATFPLDLPLLTIQCGTAPKVCGLCGSPYARLRDNLQQWRATCSCNAEATSAICLDPFAGSGTTLLAALKLGRRSVGIELNPKYAAASVERLQKRGKSKRKQKLDEKRTKLI